MYNYSEIRLQNMQDVFSLLYLCLSDHVLGSCGALKGERIIREAVRRTGKDSGLSMRKRHLEAGILTNLKTLKECGSNLIPDPRFRGKIVASEEDRLIWEVYSCPLAHFWNWRGQSKIGSFFCEEFTRARVTAYTEGKGQLNLSNRLTCMRDEFCMFAAFYREANLSPEMAAASFSHCTKKPEAIPLPEPMSFRQSIGFHAASFYCRLYETCLEMAEDFCEDIFRNGLSAFLEEVNSLLCLKASNTGKKTDAIFLKQNFLFEPDPEKDSSWDGFHDTEALHLMKNMVLIPLSERFGGTAADE